MPKYSPEEVAQAMRALRSRLVGYSLGEAEQLESKNAVILERGGLISRTDYVEATIVDTPEEWSWLGGVRGPLIVYGVGDAKKVQRLRDGVLGLTSAERTHALEALGETASEEPQSVLASTHGQAVDGSSQLIGDGDEWKAIGLALHDAIKGDFLLNLAGVRQCLAVTFNLGFREFIRAVFAPTEESARSLFGAVTPLPKQDECLEFLSGLQSEAQGLESLLQGYFERLGHLPLDGELSAGALVSRFLDGGGESLDIWGEVWRWADEGRSPLAQYHACQVFVYLPDQVPPTKFGELLTRLRWVLAPLGDGDSAHRRPQAWHLRHALARHYSKHLMCLFPGTSSEGVTALAWWVSERVATAFGHEEEVLRQVREKNLSEVSRIANVTWELMHPVLEPSLLRFATHDSGAMWGLALLAQLSDPMYFADNDTAPDDVQEVIRDAALDHFVSMSAIAEGSSVLPYTLALPLRDVIESAVEASTEEDYSKKLQVFLEAVGRMEAVESALEMLKEIARGEEMHDNFVVSGIRAHAYGAAPELAGGLWTLLSSSEWRARVLAGTSIECLALLFDALVEVQVRERGDWDIHFPHFLAMAAEAHADDDERRDSLFALTVFSSLSSGTKSAIRRVLTGPQRHKFAEDVHHWREQLRAVRGFSEWMDARLRDVLASLRLA